jgi:hypothetical protein
MVDFYPSLYYSLRVNPDIPMLEYQGHVSVSITVAKEFKKPLKTELGEIVLDVENRQQLNYRAGSPHNSASFKAIDVWREVQSILGVPDVTGKLRTVMQPVPKLLMEHDLLSSGSPLTIVDAARGCFSGKMRQVTGLPIFNIIRHAKIELVSKELANYGESETMARFKRMRSVWKTQSIVGWTGLDPIIRPLCQELTREKWFQDSIEVRGFNVPINHIIVDGQIYTMHKLRRLLAI